MDEQEPIIRHTITTLEGEEIPIDADTYHAMRSGEPVAINDADGTHVLTREPEGSVVGSGFILADRLSEFDNDFGDEAPGEQTAFYEPFPQAQPQYDQEPRFVETSVGGSGHATSPPPPAAPPSSPESGIPSAPQRGNWSPQQIGEALGHGLAVVIGSTGEAPAPNVAPARPQPQLPPPTRQQPPRLRQQRPMQTGLGDRNWATQPPQTFAVASAPRVLERQDGVYQPVPEHVDEEPDYYDESEGTTDKRNNRKAIIGASAALFVVALATTFVLTERGDGKDVTAAPTAEASQDATKAAEAKQAEASQSAEQEAKPETAVPFTSPGEPLVVGNYIVDGQATLAAHFVSAKNGWKWTLPTDEVSDRSYMALNSQWESSAQISPEAVQIEKVSETELNATVNLSKVVINQEHVPLTDETHIFKADEGIAEGEPAQQTKMWYNTRVYTAEKIAALKETGKLEKGLVGWQQAENINAMFIGEQAEETGEAISLTAEATAVKLIDFEMSDEIAEATKAEIAEYLHEMVGTQNTLNVTWTGQLSASLPTFLNANSESLVGKQPVKQNPSEGVVRLTDANVRAQNAEAEVIAVAPVEGE